MTVKLSLDTEQEERLRKAAQARGLEADTLAKEIFQHALDQIEVSPSDAKGLVLGLHEGEGWISDDFDAPLPDSFWLGEEK